MNSKLEAFADRMFDYCVAKIGLAHTRLLVMGVGVGYVLGVIKTVWWLWVTHGPVVASASVVSGLVLHCVSSLRKQRHAEARKECGSYPQHSTDSALLSAECLLCFFLPKKVRDDLFGDLQEEYSEMCCKFGKRFAKWWLYKQVVTSLWPMLQKMGRNITKLELIGWLEEFIRRIAH